MIVERDIDCGALYEHTRRTLLALLRSLSPDQLGTTVPATPAWTVRDVLAHLVGITVDLGTGRFGPGDQEAWTAAQIAQRAGRTIDELAAEWDAEAPRFEEGLQLLGYEVGSHFVGDLLQHLADVRHAIGRPGVADLGVALTVSVDFYLDSFHQTLLETPEVGAVTAEVGGDRWHLGAGPIVATVSADAFELFRALGGRRSIAQMRALAWTGDVDAVVDLLSRYGVPAADLVEPPTDGR